MMFPEQEGILKQMTFRLELQYQLFLGSLACQPTPVGFGLASLYNHISQSLIINK